MSIEPKYRIIGRKVRAWRISQNLTQQQLSRLVGLARSSIANIELGKQRVSLHKLEVIAKKLNTTINDLSTNGN